MSPDKGRNTGQGVRAAQSLPYTLPSSNNHRLFTTLSTPFSIIPQRSRKVNKFLNSVLAAAHDQSGKGYTVMLNPLVGSPYRDVMDPARKSLASPTRKTWVRT